MKDFIVQNYIILMNLNKIFLIDFSERGRKRKRERERNIHCLPPVHIPTGDQIHNLDMCPDGESNQWMDQCSKQLSQTGQG